MKKDYFAILGLKPGASDKEIRSAYKKLAKKHHPDLNPNDKKAEERFKEINEAYDVLSDPEKRSKWESGDLDFESFFRGAGGAGAPGGGPFRSYEYEDAADLGDILGDLFGGMAGAGGSRRTGRSGRPGRGADLQYQTTISFEEAVRGTTLRIPLARTVACGTCGGEGFTGKGTGKSCPRCGGRGRVTMGSGPLKMASTCPDCGGSGGSRGDPCGACGGSGVQRSSENIQVRIPPGAEDGSKVRVAGKGEAGIRGGPAGDLYVLLNVAPHPYFRRDGRDLILDLPLTVAEATLGTHVDVPTIDGRVKLTVPAGSNSGQRLRLKGRGVHSRNAGGRGDQIVILQIVTPQSVDTRSRKMLEELDRLNPANPREGLGW